MPKHCEEPGCVVQPTFGYPGQAKRFCGRHKAEAMLDLKSKRCEYQGCTVVPSFGYEGNTRQFCGVHKKEGMVNMRGKRCEAIGCSTSPSFGYIGDAKSRFCARHRSENMIDLMHKRCEAPGCTVRPIHGYEGEAPRFCSRHRLNDMIKISAAGKGAARRNSRAAGTWDPGMPLALASPVGGLLAGNFGPGGLAPFPFLQEEATRDAAALAAMAAERIAQNEKQGDAPSSYQDPESIAAAAVVASVSAVSARHPPANGKTESAASQKRRASFTLPLRGALRAMKAAGLGGAVESASQATIYMQHLEHVESNSNLRANGFELKKSPASTPRDIVVKEAVKETRSKEPKDTSNPYKRPRYEGIKPKNVGLNGKSNEFNVAELLLKLKAKSTADEGGSMVESSSTLAYNSSMNPPLDAGASMDSSSTFAYNSSMNPPLLLPQVVYVAPGFESQATPSVQQPLASALGYSRASNASPPMPNPTFGGEGMGSSNGGGLGIYNVPAPSEVVRSSMAGVPMNTATTPASVYSRTHAPVFQPSAVQSFDSLNSYPDPQPTDTPTSENNLLDIPINILDASLSSSSQKPFTDTLLEIPDKIFDKDEVDRSVAVDAQFDQILARSGDMITDTEFEKILLPDLLITSHGDMTSI